MQDIWLYLSFINIKEVDFWPLMSSSEKVANYLMKAIRGNLAESRGLKMKIWPQIDAKMHTDLKRSSVVLKLRSAYVVLVIVYGN